MIEKIILKVGQKTIELTDEEVREVWNDLNQRYGQPAYVPYPIVYPSTYPQRQPWEPVIWYTSSDCQSTYS